MKIGIFSDTHGNLIALKAIYNRFSELGCDEVIHTGDVISIGPMSAECLDFMFEHNITMVNGNHDVNYINYETTPPAQSHVPAEHKAYIFDSLGDKYRERMRYLPMIVKRNVYGRKFAFLHYGFAHQNLYRRGNFEAINPEPTVDFLDRMYEGIDADVVFYGHKHEPSEFFGKCAYVDVGSVGCHSASCARGIVLDVDEKGYKYERVYVPYDRYAIKKQFIDLNIPFGEELFNFYYREFENEDKNK